MWLFNSEVSGKTLKEAQESANESFTGRDLGFVFSHHNKISPTQTQGRRDPGCHGKGHPDFALMDSSDSVAEEELSWTPWQQATDRQKGEDA